MFAMAGVRTPQISRPLAIPLSVTWLLQLDTRAIDSGGSGVPYLCRTIIQYARRFTVLLEGRMERPCKFEYGTARCQILLFPLSFLTIV
jgi:hypothetical protein